MVSSDGSVRRGGAARGDGVGPGRQPKLTPSSRPEMDAYTKAGTPGAPHKKMAESAGSYTVTAKSWMDPAAPPTVETGTATRKVILDGRSWWRSTPAR